MSQADQHGVSGSPSRPKPSPNLGSRVGLALGGGAARGLAHIGVLEVLERESIHVQSIAGSSIGALIGALSARGLRASEIRELARTFRFPRRFVPGRLADFDRIFASALQPLSCRFEDLTTEFIATAVDVESGSEILLHDGSVLPAVRASCAVPGVLPPVPIDGRWLIDGSLVNVLPVDTAWLSEPHVVIAVPVGRSRERNLPALASPVAASAFWLGRIAPNPLTGMILFDVLVRASEIALSRQSALAAAMAVPEVVIEPDLTGIGLRDFERLDEACAAGRDAAERALPELIRVLDSPLERPDPTQRSLTVRIDPVCRMAISPSRARDSERLGEETYYFCSTNCHDAFRRDPARYSEPARRLEA